MMTLASTCHCVRDAFNAAQFLEIDRISGHDMFVQTASLDPFVSGPAARVYNYAGSMSDHHVALHAYFSVLADSYGVEPDVIPADHLQLPLPVDKSHTEDAVEISILDTPEDQIYLRVLRTDRCLGFQTLQAFDYFKHSGPVVWFDKNLRATRAEAAALDDVVLRYARHLELA